jgi:hypothetical protein
MLKFCLFAMVFLVSTSLMAEVSKGEILERHMLKDIKAKNWAEVEKNIAPYFQAVLLNKILNREEVLIDLKKSSINEHVLSNIKVTQGPNVFIVTYDISLTETLSGNTISSKASRISVWHNNNGIWQWAAHGVLIPMSQT